MLSAFTYRTVQFRMIHIRFAAPVIYHLRYRTCDSLQFRQKTAVMCFSVSHCDWCSAFVPSDVFPIESLQQLYSCNCRAIWSLIEMWTHSIGPNKMRFIAMVCLFLTFQFNFKAVNWNDYLITFRSKVNYTKQSKNNFLV